MTYTLSRGLNLLTNVVLARLLVPTDFGLVALAALLLGAIGLAKDLGLVNLLVVDQGSGTEGRGTILTLLLLTGVGVAAATSAMSPLAASFFGQPRLTSVLPALSGTVVLGGFGWFYDALLQREMLFRRRFGAYAIQSVVYGGSAVALAASGAGVWSLVVGQLAGMAAFTIALLCLAPYRQKPEFSRRDARRAVSAGRGYLLQGSLAYVEQNVDYLVVGRALGSAQLGIYSMAYRLGELPYWGIADPVAKVTFPWFARLQREQRSVGPSYLSALRFVAFVAVPIGVLLSAAAAPFTHAVFGAHWEAMIGPLGLFGLWAAAKPIQVTAAWLLNSLRHGGLVGVVSGVALGAQLPLLIAAAVLGDITTVALVMLVHIAALATATIVLVHRKAGISLSSQWEAIRPALFGAAVAWPAARGTLHLIGGDLAPGVALAAAVAAGIAAYLAMATLLAPGIVGGTVRRTVRAVRGQPNRGALGMTAETERP